MRDGRRAVPGLNNSRQPLPTTMSSQGFFSKDHILLKGKKTRTAFALHIIYSAWRCDTTNRGMRERSSYGIHSSSKWIYYPLSLCIWYCTFIFTFSYIYWRNFRGWLVCRCQTQTLGLLLVAASFLTTWRGVAGVKPCVGVSLQSR